jgi:anti-sigma factor RsiW
MDCTAVRQELVALLDGEVPEGLKAGIEAHVKGCPDCAREMRALEASWKMLDHSLPPGPSADFTAKVMERIKGQSPEKPHVSSGGSVVEGWVVTIAILLVTGLTVLMLWEHSRSSGPGLKMPAVAAPSSEPVAEEITPSVAAVEVKAPVVLPEPVVNTAPLPEPQIPVTMPEPMSVPVTPPVPVPTAPVVPVMAKVDKDRDIIANLDMYENADLLKKMDALSDMDVVASMKEASS